MLVNIEVGLVSSGTNPPESGFTITSPLRFFINRLASDGLLVTKVLGISSPIWMALLS